MIGKNPLEACAMPLPLKTLGYAALAGLLLFSFAAKADEDVWPALKQQATAVPKMNPRDSAPMTRSMFFPR